MQGTHHVAGHVNLGDDGNVALGSILDEFLSLFLSVEAAIGDTVVLAGIAADDGLLTHRALLGEQRTALDLYSPALVLGQMPVEAVDVVQGQHVDMTLQRVHAEDVTRHVKHVATIGKTGSVVDFHTGQSHGCVLGIGN